MAKRQRVLLYDTDLPAEQLNAMTADRLRRDDELSKRELEFCFRWTSCYDPARAAISSGYSPSRAVFVTRQLLKDPRIKRQVAIIEADRLKRLRFDGDVFLAQELMLASADVTELQQVWVPPCRYCWGKNFEYQRTWAEFNEAFEAWQRLPDKRQRRQPAYASMGTGDAVLVYDEGGAKLPFDQRGGDGYDVEQPPNPACPNCRGRGLEVAGVGSCVHVKFKDTRDLSDAGKLLFGGVEPTARGTKLLLRSQDAARTRLMGMLGKFLELRARPPQDDRQLLPRDPTDLKLGVLSSVADVITDDPESYTDEQLDAMLAASGVVIDEDGEVAE
ncbi:MAG: terminase small subunit [Elusimicrobia bacterium]|nr:terminase small subunit [Elusimicrobiota bacterium]